ncbi:MAG: 6-phosphogluconolactonase [Propionibacteriaceae bacterium]|nr:6-phosphogluconolactonase [Propionibacteriaceae bacterium]
MTDDTPTIIVHPDLDLTAVGIASRLITHLVERQSVTHPLHVSLTGGGLGTAIWPLMATHPLAPAVDWTGVHLWFSDERFVADSDPDRNDRAVLTQADVLGIPPDNIHRIPGPDQVPDIQVAAQQYARRLAEWAHTFNMTHVDTRTRDNPSSDAENPSNPTPLPAPWFEVSLLGIGPDGHVASLFPGSTQVSIDTCCVVPVTDSPKPPAQRVSFTRPLLARCDQLWMLAAGSGKAPAVSRALAGDDPVRTPAAGLRGRTRTLWFVDADLAQALS